MRMEGTLVMSAPFFVFDVGLRTGKTRKCEYGEGDV